MRNRFALVRAILLGAALLVGVTGCRAVAPFSDDAIRAARGLFRTQTDDEAVAILKQAVKDTGREAPLIERATLAWSARVVPVRDRIMARITAAPDDEARIRTFVVSSTCDAIQEAEDSPTGTLGESRIRDIIAYRNVTSRLPAITGYAEMIDDLVSEISAAIAAGDLASSYAGLAQIFICQQLGG